MTRPDEGKRANRRTTVELRASPMLGFGGATLESIAMPNDNLPDKTDNPLQGNDTRLLTPLLLMALIIAVGLLLFAVTGQTPSAS
jgi:hypothetical protein